ncbi:MAG: hypothetical protein K8R23_03690 [Chthoniobacter sp.]|nr:hypothetical protein [Chthoniobacter sp.]
MRCGELIQTSHAFAPAAFAPGHLSAQAISIANHLVLGVAAVFRHTFMTTPKTFLLLLVSSTMLSAGDPGLYVGKTYWSDAPDKRFSVQAHQEKGYGKFDAEIIDLASNKAVLTYSPKARFIAAAWTPDSKLVAIEQNRTVHDSAVSVFSLGKDTAKRVVLPKGCNYEDNDDDGDPVSALFESPTRKQAKKVNSLGFHIAVGAYGIKKWIRSDTLVLSAMGRGWWGGDVARDGDVRFNADYKLTIHVAADGTSSLQKIELENYEEH